MKKTIKEKRKKRKEQQILWFFGSLLSALLFLAPFYDKAYAAAAEGEPGQPVPSQGNAHIQSPGSPHAPYNSDPPTSGPHVSYIARWGIHKAPILHEVQVHNLEDGGVVIQYDCKDCEDLIAKLEGIVRKYQEKARLERAKTNPRHPSRYERLVLSPYPGMDARIALTAWGRIDKLDEFDEARIVRFIEAYIGIDHHPAKGE